MNFAISLIKIKKYHELLNNYLWLHCWFYLPIASQMNTKIIKELWMNLEVFKRFKNSLKWSIDSSIVLKYSISDNVSNMMTC